MPGAWLVASFTIGGLEATTVDTPCLSDAERAAAAEAAAAEARRVAELEAERRRRAGAEAAQAAEAAAERRRQAEEAAAAAEAEAADRRQQADEAAAAEQQAAADRARFVRRAVIAGAAVSTLATFLWWISRCAIARARQAESTAEAVQSDLSDRDARDRLANEVPAVFLEGTDAEGHPIALRIPGSVIAGAAGAVVGRHPYDSTVVLDHAELSRRHFRLFASGASVLIEDLNSMNGTTINDLRLMPETSSPLQSGAMLNVGGLKLTVTLQT